MIEIRWHGRGGQGGWTAARLLGKAAALYENQYALAFPSFGPERRGAPVLGFTKIDDKKILDRSEVKACDFVVILDETLMIPATMEGVKADATVVLNTVHPEKYCDAVGERTLVTIDATSLALTHLGRPITNTVMLAALAAASGLIGLPSLLAAMKSELKPSVLEKNVAAVRAVFDIFKGGKDEPA